MPMPNRMSWVYQKIIWDGYTCHKICDYTSIITSYFSDEKESLLSELISPGHTVLHAKELAKMGFRLIIKIVSVCHIPHCLSYPHILLTLWWLSQKKNNIQRFNFYIFNENFRTEKLLISKQKQNTFFSSRMNLWNEIVWDWDL